MSEKYIKKTLEIKKRKRIPDHYVKDIDFILYEFIDAIKESRARQHSTIMQNPEIKGKLIKLIMDAKELQNDILLHKQGK